MSKTEEAPMYQPLSEQKPTFNSKTVPNYTQPVNDTLNQMNQSQSNIMLQQENSIQNVIPTPIAQMNQNVVEPMNQTMQQNNMPTQYQMQQNNNIGMMPNNTNNNTIPQPVNSIQTPQPINPQSIMSSNGYNQYGMNQQPSQNIGNQQPTNKLPVNFVFGPQNNNQNM